MPDQKWALGVDLGGTKVEVEAVDEAGKILARKRFPTEAKRSESEVVAEIGAVVKELKQEFKSAPNGVGIGVAGQIDKETGVVHFAPNLKWEEVPLQEMLQKETGLPVVVTNDVRAATWGEWIHGAGQRCSDIVCLFIGTGIGGGVVSHGEMLAGCSNTAGEIGHMTVDLTGPLCTCGNRGCMEAIGSGWAITKQAKEVIERFPIRGERLLQNAGEAIETLTTKNVIQAFREGDPLAQEILEKAAEGIIAGSAALINAFNPCYLILGGGIVDGLPELVEWVEHGVRRRALAAATAPLQVTAAALGNEAGAIGAATLALKTFSNGRDRR